MNGVASAGMSPCSSIETSKRLPSVDNLPSDEMGCKPRSKPSDLGVVLCLALPWAMHVDSDLDLQGFPVLGFH